MRLTPSRANFIEAIAGYAVGLGCLYWLFRNVPFREFLQSLAAVDWWLLAPCAVLMLLAYLVVAWEWQLLLRPVGAFPFGRAAQAVFAGCFANGVLPLHVGWVVRALMASRWMGVGLTAMAPPLMMERLADGFWLAAGAGALSLAVPLPADVIHGRNILAAMVLGGGVATAAIILLRPRNSAPTTHRPCARRNIFAGAKSFVQGAADGMRDIARSQNFGLILLLAFLRLAAQAAAILILLRAYRLQLSLAEGLGVFVAGYIATCAPTTAAGAGLFQVVVVGILGFFGVDKPVAASFSLVSFVTLTLPPVVVGFFSFAGSGLTLRQVRASSRI